MRRILLFFLFLSKSSKSTTSLGSSSKEALVRREEDSSLSEEYPLQSLVAHQQPLAKVVCQQSLETWSSLTSFASSSCLRQNGNFRPNIDIVVLATIVARAR